MKRWPLPETVQTILLLAVGAFLALASPARAAADRADIADTADVPTTDADRDGIPDSNDRCPDTLTGARVDVQGCILESMMVTVQGVHFATGTAQLTSQSLPVLRQAAAALRGQPSMRIEVRGHTDASGGAAANLRLSQQRADVVVAFLVSQGIDRARLESSGHGEALPVTDETTPAARERNRRVEFRILSR